MVDDDFLLAEVRRRSGNTREQRAWCDRALASAEPVAKKARWAYSHYLARTGQDCRVSPAFIPGYLRAWRDSILYLVNGPGRLRIEADENPHQTILAGWHFAEHTALLHAFSEFGSPLVLVAQEQSWMQPLRERGCLYCFRNAPPLALVRALKAGRPVFAMLDFCYPETRQLVTNFLSYQSRMPAGLLQLASHFGYSIRLLSIRGNTLRGVSDIPAKGRRDSEIAADLNRCLELEIMRRPERWLLWPSVDQRWIGVDYGEDTSPVPIAGTP